MIANIRPIDSVQRITNSDLYTSMSDRDQRIMDMWFARSQQIWMGIIHGEVVCACGVVTPTLLSSKAYLWLYTTDKVEEYKFVFVRYSQRALEEVLTEFYSIVGHTKAYEKRSIRWLKWLGASFSAEENGMLAFEIRKKNG